MSIAISCQHFIDICKPKIQVVAIFRSSVRILTSYNVEKQIEGGKDFAAAIEGLVKLFERTASETGTDVGLWTGSDNLSFADVMAAPCKLHTLSKPRNSS